LEEINYAHNVLESEELAVMMALPDRNAFYQ
jgi:hypothetical protein